jgi:hypothetical protein
MSNRTANSKNTNCNKSNRDVSVSVIQESTAEANKMVDQRISETTKSRYKGRIKTMKEWVIEMYNIHKWKVPLEADIVKAYFGSLINQPASRKKQVSVSVIQGTKSALRWRYQEHGVTIEAELDRYINHFISGYKRKIADLKQSGKMKLKEGKSPLSFSNYKMLAQKIIKFAPPNNATVETKTAYEYNYNQNIFAWAYLVLQWNLMARANNVARIMLEHISWSEDSLVIALPKTKTEQEGANDYPRHIYANPYDPCICAILSLAVNIFSRNFNCIDENYNFNCLFEGTNQEDRFSKILGNVLHDLSEDEKKLLGVSIKELGTHSMRKGSTSYCTGMMGGPNIVSILVKSRMEYRWSTG